MNESERLADQLERALLGGAWHGPSWADVLQGVTREEAVQHPIGGAHSILEILQHTLAWHGVVRLRLLGESPQLSDEEDWPVDEPADEPSWEALTTRLFETGRALRDTIAAFPPERLHERRPGLEGTWYELIMGELQHVLYHAGQVPMLRKALARSQQGRR